MSTATLRAPDDVLARSLSNRILELTLMPTEACNFRCTYCYEDFALGRMSPSVVLGLKRLISARAPGLDELHLAWFGGEPLLALDVIRDVHAHAAALQREHPDLLVTANMTTNAWRLTPPVFAELVGLGVSQYQISFDGPPEQHDAKRRRLDGKPTFQRIWANVAAMRTTDLDFRVLLRLHVDRENVDTMHVLVDRLRAEFGSDPRFEIFLKPLARYGGSNDARLPVLESEDDARRYARLEQHVRAGASADPAHAAAKPAPPKVCYASKGNSYVVRADGRLCKCTVVLDHPENEVGRLHEDGTVAIDPDRVRPWMRGLWSGNATELFCPMLGFASPRA